MGSRKHGKVTALAGLTVLATVLLGAVAQAQSVDADLASKIILKILVLDTQLQEKTGGDVSVGVIGSPAALKAFSALKGAPIDRGKRFRVSDVLAMGSMPPGRKPTMIFIGDAADPEKVTHYTRENGVLSVTNVPSYVERGVTLGVGIENNRPKVILNLTGSESEGMNWDAKILKISRTIR